MNHLISYIRGQYVWGGRENTCLGMFKSLWLILKLRFSGGSWCLVYDSSGSKPFLSQEASVLIFFKIKNNVPCSCYQNNA